MIDNLSDLFVEFVELLRRRPGIFRKALSVLLIHFSQAAGEFFSHQAKIFGSGPNMLVDFVLIIFVGFMFGFIFVDFM